VLNQEDRVDLVASDSDKLIMFCIFLFNKKFLPVINEPMKLYILLLTISVPLIFLIGYPHEKKPHHPDVSDFNKSEGVQNNFQVPEGFVVEEVFGNDEVGSVVAITFDNQGRMVLAKEFGEIVVMVPSGDGDFEQRCCIRSNY
jgi:hypothetical protein